MTLSVSAHACRFEYIWPCILCVCLALISSGRRWYYTRHSLWNNEWYFNFFFFPRVSLDSSAPRESQGFQDSQELRWGIFCLECIIHANDSDSFDRFLAHPVRVIVIEISNSSGFMVLLSIMITLSRWLSLLFLQNVTWWSEWANASRCLWVVTLLQEEPAVIIQTRQI